MDFQFDVTADGRTLKMLNVIDEYTREALALEQSTLTVLSPCWIALPGSAACLRS